MISDALNSLFEYDFIILRSMNKSLTNHSVHS